VLAGVVVVVEIIAGQLAIRDLIGLFARADDIYKTRSDQLKLLIVQLPFGI